MLGFIRNCFHLADVNARRLLYSTLVCSQLLHGCEVWAPQGASSNLFRLESIQRRSTKFILNDYESCYLICILKDLSINQPVQFLATFCVQTCAELLYLGTRSLIELFILWNQLPNDIKLSTSVSILKSKLFSYYSDKLNTVFDINRPRTWKTLCSKS